MRSLALLPAALVFMLDPSPVLAQRSLLDVRGSTTASGVAGALAGDVMHHTETNAGFRLVLAARDQPGSEDQRVDAQLSAPPDRAADVLSVTFVLGRSTEGMAS